MGIDLMFDRLIIMFIIVLLVFIFFGNVFDRIFGEGRRYVLLVLLVVLGGYIKSFYNIKEMRDESRRERSLSKKRALLSPFQIAQCEINFPLPLCKNAIEQIAEKDLDRALSLANNICFNDGESKEARSFKSVIACGDLLKIKAAYNKLENLDEVMDISCLKIDSGNCRRVMFDNKISAKNRAIVYSYYMSNVKGSAYTVSNAKGSAHALSIMGDMIDIVKVDTVDSVEVRNVISKWRENCNSSDENACKEVLNFTRAVELLRDNKVKQAKKALKNIKCRYRDPCLRQMKYVKDVIREQKH